MPFACPECGESMTVNKTETKFDIVGGLATRINRVRVCPRCSKRILSVETGYEEGAPAPP